MLPWIVVVIVYCYRINALRVDIFSSSYIYIFLINIQGLGMERGNEWTDSSTVVFHNFVNITTNFGCAFLQNDGKWGMEGCKATKRVLCKRGKIT